ncbi:uncharacterized protein LOC6536451 [Drosophila yakuba]|uniref:Uncharacterized protein n=1 Tax=Drosophila yakuba TaxID=7245 RepID=B4PVH1_DROYA|nr:uncharacterized protein LOC6536451 [Drosophila yakuba]EDW96744.1 uncharacterized protein Dyak_GE24719 [Drosophila yakuba]
MDPLRRNPLLEVTKCDMCPNLVYHFPTGLCVRCLTLLTGKKQPDGMRSTVDQSKAILVDMARSSDGQDQGQMDPAFQRVIAEIRMQRQQKIELFQTIRHQFQLSVLTAPFHDTNPKYEVKEDYWNVSDIVDQDTLMFQHEVDLLGDIPQTSSGDFFQGNNEKRENRKRKL